MAEPQWLTLKAAMEYLSVSDGTLYRWMDSGRLRYYELESGGGRRFKREDLDAMLRDPKAVGPEVVE